MYEVLDSIINKRNTFDFQFRISCIFNWRNSTHVRYHFLADIRYCYGSLWLVQPIASRKACVLRGLISHRFRLWGLRLCLPWSVLLCLCRPYSISLVLVLHLDRALHLHCCTYHRNSCSPLLTGAPPPQIEYQLPSDLLYLLCWDDSRCDSFRPGP